MLLGFSAGSGCDRLDVAERCSPAPSARIDGDGQQKVRASRRRQPSAKIPNVLDPVDSIRSARLPHHAVFSEYDNHSAVSLLLVDVKRLLPALCSLSLTSLQIIVLFVLLGKGDTAEEDGHSNSFLNPGLAAISSEVLVEGIGYLRTALEGRSPDDVNTEDRSIRYTSGGGRGA